MLPQKHFLREISAKSNERYIFIQNRLKNELKRGSKKIEDSFTILEIPKNKGASEGHKYA